MASLTGKQIRNSYDGLLKTQDNGAVTSAEKPVTDGLGNATILSIGTSTATFNGNVTATKFIKSGGNSSQFLKADGSVDSTTYQDKSEKGSALGYVPLNAGAKIDESYLPDSVVGQVEYQGTWNASTNTPTLPSASTVKGHFYIVSTAGIYLTIYYAVGDWIISDGTAWSKVDNTDAVTNFNGRLGGIIPIQTDYDSFFYTKSLLDGGQLDTRYYTESESDSRFVNATGDIMSGSLTATSFVGDGSGLTDVFNAKSELGGLANLNNFRTTGYMSQNSNSQAGAGTNYPVSFAGMLEVINDDTGNGLHTVQRYSRYNSNDVYTRYYFNGSWQSWTRFLTVSDEGSGNGLDADTVDSKHATDFTLDYVTDNGATTSNSITVGGLTVDTDTLFVDAANNRVGVGTPSPLAKLHIASTNAAITDPLAVGNALRFTDNDSTQNNGQITGTIEWETKDADNAGIQAYITSISTNTGLGNLSFATGAGGSAAERMRIDSSGNVGIGVVPASSVALDIKESTAGSDLILGLTAGTGARAQIRSFNQSDSTTAELGFYTVTGGNTSERMRIDSSGNVGIGESNPAYALDVKDTGESWIRVNSSTATNDTGYRFAHAGTNHYVIGHNGTSDCLQFYNNVATREDMRIDSSGNVGIGESNPVYTLDVNGGTDNTIARFASTDQNATIELKDNTSRTDIVQNVGQFELRIDPNDVGAASKFIVDIDGSEKFRITNGGNVGIGASSPASSVVSSGAVIVDLKGNAINRGGVVNFRTSDSSKIAWVGFDGGLAKFGTETSNDAVFYTTNTERMRIDSSGNVGITSSASIRFNTTSDETHAVGYDSTVDGSFLRGQNGVRFITGTGSGTERMRINSSGNVGIGTTSPSEKLHVKGSLRLQDSTDTTTRDHTLKVETNGALSFTDSASGERMRIDWNGNVGINTNSPVYKLSVNTNGDTYSADFYQANSGTDKYNAVRVRGAMTSAVGYYGIGGSTVGNTSFRDAFVVGTQSAHSLNLATSDTARMTITSAGDVGIGNTSPSYKLDVTGTIRASSDIIAFSDARVKENVKTIDNALDKVIKLRGVSYNKIGETEEKIGVIAQEVEKVLPQVVSTDDDGMKAVAYANMVGLLIEAVKEQQKQIDELKTMLNA